MPKQKRRLRSSRIVRVGVLAGALAAVLGGGYVLLLLAAPRATQQVAPALIPMPHAVAATVPRVADDRVYLPKIGVDISYAAGTARVLNDGAWHRFPERGDPVKGGNFILAAHRFQIGLTPGETKRRSPFYNLNHVQVGDPIYIDFSGVRYKYIVTRHYTVGPGEVGIEAPSAAAKLTLYSCTLKGDQDGREVLEATIAASNLDPRKPMQ